MPTSNKNIDTSALVLATIIINIGMRYGSDALYFFGDAYCYVLLALALLYNTKSYAKVFAQLLVALTVSNLLDELLTDASVLNFSEIVIAVMAFVWAGFTLFKMRREA